MLPDTPRDTFCDLFTSDQPMCLDNRILKVNTGEYCVDITGMRTEDGRDGTSVIVLTYAEFLALSKAELVQLVHIATSSRHHNGLFFYHIALILAILNRTDGDRREKLLCCLLQDAQVDPYYMISQAELEHMILRGQMDALLYTVTEILHNPYINLVKIKYELKMYQELVQTIQQEYGCDAPDGSRWPSIAKRLIKRWVTRVYNIRYGARTYTLTARDTAMFYLLSMTQDSTRCDRGQYWC